MLLQSIETGREVLLSTHNILKGLEKNRLIGSFLWLIKRTPPLSTPVPPHSSSRAYQARKDKKEKKEYLKQMSELAKIVRQQRLENKKLEKLLSDSKRQALQLSVALSQKQESPPADPSDKFVSSEVTGSYYAVARERRFESSGIYADVKSSFLKSMGWLDHYLKYEILIPKITST
jgi:hypothetical protein